TALWQAERAGRPAGPLLMDDSGDRRQAPGCRQNHDRRAPAHPWSVEPGAWGLPPDPSPLPSMSLPDRVRADYDGTGLTIGPHPMSLLRGALAVRGVLRASDLLRERTGRRVRAAGAVIVR